MNRDRHRLASGLLDVIEAQTCEPGNTLTTDDVVRVLSDVLRAMTRDIHQRTDPGGWLPPEVQRSSTVPHEQPIAPGSRGQA